MSRVMDELADIEGALDTLREHIEHSPEVLQRELQRGLDRLEDQLTEVEATLAELRTATVDSWADVRARLEFGVAELRRGCRAQLVRATIAAVDDRDRPVPRPWSTSTPAAARDPRSWPQPPFSLSPAS